MMISTIMIFFHLEVNIYAQESYLTYNEIIMSTGKLLSYYTNEEYEKYYQEVEKVKFFGINVYTVNKNIDATYISQTIYNVDNLGMTDVEYELNIVVETSNTTTWNVSGSINGEGNGTIKGFKTELALKAGVDYKNTTTSSKKETQKMKVTIEKQSRAIVYLMGNARITNGVYAIYMIFLQIDKGGFEYFSLVNQYPRLEKRSL